MGLQKATTKNLLIRGACPSARVLRPTRHLLKPRIQRYPRSLPISEGIETSHRPPHKRGRFLNPRSLPISEGIETITDISNLLLYISSSEEPAHQRGY